MRETTTTTTTTTVTTTTVSVEPNRGLRVDIQPFVDESTRWWIRDDGSFAQTRPKAVVKWTARIETAEHVDIIKEKGAPMRDVLRAVEKFFNGLKRHQRKGVSHVQSLMADDMWESARGLDADGIAQ